jgi:exodeoxyribonuclease V alpha subunit
VRLLAAEPTRLRPYADRVDPSSDLTDGQAAAVRAVFEHPVSVLTGGPGTGKTRTVEEVVLAAEEVGTGRRPVRPNRAGSQADRGAGRRPAMTVHRLLEARPTGDGGFSFRYGRFEQVPFDLVVVDEVSMCDTRLAERLVSAVEEGAHLLLVGDPDQLPSVGPGDVLRDLVRCGVVPVTELTEVHRQAADSRIVGLAREVLAGEVGELRGVDGDVFLAEERSRHRIVPRVVEAVANRAPDYFGVDVDDVQVLAPMYRGPAGRGRPERRAQGRAQPGSRPPSRRGFPRR